MRWKTVGGYNRKKERGARVATVSGQGGRSGFKEWHMEEVKLEMVLTSENLRAAWRRVRRNNGAPGVDRKTIHDTKEHLKQHWPGIRDKLPVIVKPVVA